MKAGVYIHIPFCRSRCSYCDFATDVYRSGEAVERYVDALCKEISNFKFQISDSENQGPKPENRIETIYFGGGTPSLLSAAQLEKILSAIHQTFAVEENIEFTLEMNPATVTAEKLRAFKSLGVNRASFGVQTFNDRALKLLARGHDARDARQTFELLRRAGFDNISFDLIAGLPRQTLADWERNLDEALKLNPEHLSLYLLEIHEGTPLAEQIRARRQPAPDEDLSGAMYELMIEKTSAAGFAQYEISNFARARFESKHNSKYWLCEPVFAFGVSAHSFDGARRRANERDTNRYVSLIETGASPIVFREEIDLASEFVFLGLRMMRGVDLVNYEKNFGVDLISKYAEELERLTSLGLIEIIENRLRLTRKGALFSNEVFACFV
jgi:oxygen-independent coproporphyrinogen-3 oxidase